MAISPNEVIARVPIWEGKSDLRYTVLSGGITNYNYKIDVDNESYVLRIAGVNTELLGIDRENEYNANRIAGDLGIAPEVVYFIEPEGYIITRFINGRPMPPDEIKQKDIIRQLGELLKLLHGSGEISGTFSPFTVVETYTEIAKRFNVSFPNNFDWLHDRLQEYKTAFEKDPYVPRLCHNDLLNENFLFDGNIRIIDWEYAGMGDPFFDLANLSVNHHFTDEQDHLLLVAYFGNVNVKIWARLKIMKILSDFRESMWGLVQTGISQLDFDFMSYSEKHFDRMTKNMNDPRWDQWIQEVA
jgi:thiamine kinase-like enzyme